MSVVAAGLCSIAGHQSRFRSLSLSQRESVGASLLPVSSASSSMKSMSKSSSSPSMAEARCLLSSDGSVAFAGGVDVFDGDGERDGVVYHIGHVDVGVAVGYLQKLVGVVAVVIAIFDYNMVYGVDGEGEVVEAAVASYGDFAPEGEMQVVVVVFVLDFEVHFDVGIAHFVVLHVDKKLLTYLVVKLLAAYGHAFERQFIFSKLTHIFCQLAKNFAKVAKFFRFINFFENYFLMVANFGAKCGGVGGRDSCGSYNS